MEIEHQELSDRELVTRILATPRRRCAVESLILAMGKVDTRDERNISYRITMNGRRVAVSAEQFMGEVMLPRSE